TKQKLFPKAEAHYRHARSILEPLLTKSSQRPEYAEDLDLALTQLAGLIRRRCWEQPFADAAQLVGRAGPLPLPLPSVHPAEQAETYARQCIRWLRETFDRDLRGVLSREGLNGSSQGLEWLRNDRVFEPLRQRSDFRRLLDALHKNPIIIS